jgi:hypothetical protein
MDGIVFRRAVDGGGERRFCEMPALEEGAALMRLVAAARNASGLRSRP